MSIANALRMAGQIGAGLGAVAKAYPVPTAMLGVGLGSIPVAAMHGEKAAYADPTRSGLGGTLGYGLFANPIAGAAYGLGHERGRNKESGILGDMVNQVIPVATTPQDKAIEEYLRRRQARQDTIRSLVKAVNPMPGGYNPTIYGGNI